ncbi:DUF2335 domain-containing protein [Stigmatella aurantiaca]|uniref:DUF2335 domain-containing protein n=2 Tax=Stigmatella aurantiaca (strain DW4/3-1) TaxID=378806 RepID=E3FWB2_STIAD|nr:DUF2335 domain-containing protein [Stigmatella aurantiaca]ADO76018.1 uncharacterized protein STAUR_8263 [Stigmatella aurantiaca DW4/3-1]
MSRNSGRRRLKKNQAEIARSQARSVERSHDEALSGHVLSPERPAASGGFMAMQTSVSITSPLPPPEMVEGYGNIDPSFPARLMEMVEGQAKHRQGLERWAVIGEVINHNVATLCGAAVALFGLYASWQMGIAGKQTAASIVGGTTVVMLTSIFFYGRRQKRVEQPQPPQRSSKQPRQ